MKKHVGIIDLMIEDQKKVNQVESDICNIMAIPAGDKLLKWSYKVRSTWWYKLFSKIDPRFKSK